MGRKMIDNGNSYTNVRVNKTLWSKWIKHCNDKLIKPTTYVEGILKALIKGS